MYTLLAALVLMAAPSERALPYTPRTTTLGNGLDVVTVKTAAEGTIMYFTIVRTGSRDEVEAGKSGFAHFFEHMMFRGTPKYSGPAWSAKMAGHGADTNAYTTDDYTAYFALAPASALDDIIDLESDRFQNLAFSESDFRTEAGAVLGEYNKAASSPGMKMREVLAETAFRKHTYGHTVIGYKKDIEAMPEGFEYAKVFFKRFYTPDNCTVLVVGDVNHEAVLAKVRKAYGGWRGHKTEPEVPVEPAQDTARKATVEWASPTPPRLIVAWKIPGLNVDNTSTAAIDVAAQLLYGKTSPLYKALVLDEQKVTSLSTSAGWWNRDPSLFTVSVEYKSPLDGEALKRRISEAAAELATGKVDAERLAAAKANSRYSKLMELSSLSDVGQEYAWYIGVSGEHDLGESYLARVSEVTAEDVANAARTYFTDPRRTTVTLTQEESK